MATDIELEKKGEGEGKETPPEKNEEEVSKLEKAEKGELINYIKDLREENAKWRTKLRTEEDGREEIKRQMAENSQKLEEATTKIQEFEEKESSKKKEELAEIDRLKLEVEESQKKLSDLLEEGKKKDGKITQLLTKQAESLMLNEAMSLLDKAGFEFRSGAEKRGFKAELLEKNDAGEYKTSSQIQEFAEKFLKENAPAQKQDDDETPPEKGGEGEDNVEPAPGGPKTKVKTPSKVDRLRELMAKAGPGKPGLTREELDESMRLEAEIEKELQGK